MRYYLKCNIRTDMVCDNEAIGHIWDGCMRPLHYCKEHEIKGNINITKI